jgi:hypothetical protein
MGTKRAIKTPTAKKFRSFARLSSKPTICTDERQQLT